MNISIKKAFPFLLLNTIMRIAPKNMTEGSITIVIVRKNQSKSQKE